jgi:Polysaccharide pyruvyl transferase
MSDASSMQGAAPASRRALVAGWFSYPENFATAGDLMARDVACEWLSKAGIAFDVANAPPFEDGVDWLTVDPDRYTDLVFVCGPVWFGRRAELLLRPPAVARALMRWAPTLRRLRLDPIKRFPLELLVRRFAGAHQIGLDLTVIGSLAASPFDQLVERDSDRTIRPDIAYASAQTTVPVVGVLLVEPGSEYGRGPQADAEAAIAELIASSGVAHVDIDTRLDIGNRGGLTTAPQIESVIARMDCVITTRMHGLVLALRNGVPAVAIDPHPGGRKIFRQAEVVGWPHVVTIDKLVPEKLREALDVCLSPAGREQAQASQQRAAQLMLEVERDFVAALSAR